MIELRDVTVEVDDLASPERGAKKTLLRSISVQLGESRIAVIGANGSGKSTLLKLFNGLVMPSCGEVIIDGLSTARELVRVRKHVGYVYRSFGTARHVHPTR